MHRHGGRQPTPSLTICHPESGLGGALARCRGVKDWDASSSKPLSRVGRLEAGFHGPKASPIARKDLLAWPVSQNIPLVSAGSFREPGGASTRECTLAALEGVTNEQTCLGYTPGTTPPSRRRGVTPLPADPGLGVPAPGTADGHGNARPLWWGDPGDASILLICVVPATAAYPPGLAPIRALRRDPAPSRRGTQASLPRPRRLPVTILSAASRVGRPPFRPPLLGGPGWLVGPVRVSSVGRLFSPLSESILVTDKVGVGKGHLLVPRLRTREPLAV